MFTVWILERGTGLDVLWTSIWTWPLAVERERERERRREILLTLIMNAGILIE